MEQEFVEHEGVVYKVYVAGSDIAVVHRPSLKNHIGKIDGIAKFSRASSDSTAQKLRRNDPEWYATCIDGALPLPSKIAECVAGFVSRSTEGAHLFGVDVLVKAGGKEGHECYVVDVNHFPGFRGMDCFPSSLASLLISTMQGMTWLGDTCLPRHVT
jgi:inositol-1,3,4-trisphosphate 5/6-kinase/inositol-tetrakisphosphate 1-kinase